MLGPEWKRYQKAGENSTVKYFIVYALHKIIENFI
jgi:hypothetical protein